MKEERGSHFFGICMVIVYVDEHSRNNYIGHTERLNSANFPFQCESKASKEFD